MRVQRSADAAYDADGGGGSHGTGLAAVLLTSLPFAAAAGAGMALAHSSQRCGERFIHIGLPYLLTGAEGVRVCSGCVRVCSRNAKGKMVVCLFVCLRVCVKECKENKLVCVFVCACECLFVCVLCVSVCVCGGGCRCVGGCKPRTSFGVGRLVHGTRHGLVHSASCGAPSRRRSLTPPLLINHECNPPPPKTPTPPGAILSLYSVGADRSPWLGFAALGLGIVSMCVGGECLHVLGRDGARECLSIERGRVLGRVGRVRAEKGRAGGWANT